MSFVASQYDINPRNSIESFTSKRETDIPPCNPMRITVKYYGNSNPEINAPRIIGQWRKAFKGEHIRKVFTELGYTEANLEAPEKFG